MVMVVAVGVLLVVGVAVAVWSRPRARVPVAASRGRTPTVADIVAARPAPAPPVPIRRPVGPPPGDLHQAPVGPPPSREPVDALGAVVRAMCTDLPARGRPGAVAFASTQPCGGAPAVRVHASQIGVVGADPTATVTLWVRHLRIEPHGFVEQLSGRVRPAFDELTVDPWKGSPINRFRAAVAASVCETVDLAVVVGTSAAPTSVVAEGAMDVGVLLRSERRLISLLAAVAGGRAEHRDDLDRELDAAIRRRDITTIMPPSSFDHTHRTVAWNVRLTAAGLGG